MKIKTIKKLPRWITIPGLAKKDYRSLQSGKAVEVRGDAGQYLVSNGFAEVAEIVKETKAKAKKGGDK